jgi:hypothetical protein
MPPDGQLPDEEVAVFRRWVKDGAVDPRTAPPRPEKGVESSSKNLWSLQPLQVDDARSNSIDQFLDEHLVNAGLRPNKAAELPATRHSKASKGGKANALVQNGQTTSGSGWKFRPAPDRANQL